MKTYLHPIAKKCLALLTAVLLSCQLFAQQKITINKDALHPAQSFAAAIAQLPFMQTNLDGTLQFKQQQAYIVLVNGQQQGLLSLDINRALKALPAESIERIELNLQASDEYRLRGYDATVNIITKELATSNSAYIQGNVDTRLQSDDQFSWARQGKKSSLQFNLQYNTTANKDHIKSSSSNNTGIEEDQTTTWRSNLYALGLSYSTKLGRTWYVNLYGTTGWDQLKKENDIKYYQLGYQDGTPTTNWGGNYKHKIYDYTIGTNITKAFSKTGHQLMLSVQKSSKDHNFRTWGNTKNISPTNVQALSHINDNYLQNLLANIDYTLPIGKHARLQAGYQYNNRNIMSDAVATFFQSQSGQLSWITTLYSEKEGTSHHGYVGFTHHTSKLAINAGLNVMTTKYTRSFAKDTSYFNVLPYVNLVIKIDTNQFIQIAYQSKVQQTNFLELSNARDSFDPYLQHSNAPNYHTGILGPGSVYPQFVTHDPNFKLYQQTTHAIHVTLHQVNQHGTSYFYGVGFQYTPHNIGREASLTYYEPTDIYSHDIFTYYPETYLYSNSKKSQAAIYVGVEKRAGKFNFSLMNTFNYLQFEFVDVKKKKESFYSLTNLDITYQAFQRSYFKLNGYYGTNMATTYGETYNLRNYALAYVHEVAKGRGFVSLEAHNFINDHWHYKQQYDVKSTFIPQQAMELSYNNALPASMLAIRAGYRIGK
ncbi:outer membrane beta-barrel protein [Chitinophaga skermanii]|uniref:Outer membrane beta-barrel protein n=1 Tax=Chitinophaga skermanii TaxID=331697 RepID=A0A327Q596_9BACT|nr:outer membrane beta-barrel protein [Chitinophaga skermanii]RAI99705.1 outer membrane beta-barrel protein [Chitinophaga skermanii]